MRDITPFGYGGRVADPEICKTCKYRDKTSLTIGDQTVNVGATRDTCEKYTGENRVFKPNTIMFYDAKCEYYEKGD